MAAINANISLRSKKVSGATTSPVWQYFGFKENENDNEMPTCKICLKKSVLLEEILPIYVNILKIITQSSQARYPKTNRPNVEMMVVNHSKLLLMRLPSSKSTNGEASNGLRLSHKMLGQGYDANIHCGKVSVSAAVEGF
jgi:hypothetical protein